MAGQKVILVTGVGNYWGTRLIKRLLSQERNSQDSDFHVIGLDLEPPQEEIKNFDFIQADVRNPLIVDLLKSEGVDTVCHLVFIERVRPTEAIFDINVMGTMKMLGACAEAGVRKVVIKSSAMVYGAHPSNPAFLTEEHPLQGSRDYGYCRDLVEIEAFCNGFRRQVPEMILSVLRFSNIVGPNANTPFTRFLKQPLSPVLMGFNPLMQVVHEDDVVGALAYTLGQDAPGVFNIAAEGVLPLRRIMGLAAKMTLPVLHPFAYFGKDLIGMTGAPLGRYFPIEPDYLRYPWVTDLSHMRDVLGFEPRYTGEEALREFAGQQRLNQFSPETVPLAFDEERLRDTIERRRRARERAGS